MAKNKYKNNVVKKKKKLHPLFAALAGFFAVMIVALGVTAHVYNSQSPIQQVADAHAEVVVTATPKICTVVQSVVGTGSCVNNAYSSVTVTCGDGTNPVISFGKSTKEKSKTTATCHNLNDWMALIANACKNHSSCPNPTISVHPTEKGAPQPIEKGQTIHTNK